MPEAKPATDQTCGQCGVVKREYLRAGMCHNCYEKRRRKLKVPLLVDAAPSRERIELIRAQGVGIRKLAEQLGMDRVALGRLASGHRTVVRRSTHDAVMALPIPDPDPRAVLHRERVMAALDGSYVSPQRQYRGPVVIEDPEVAAQYEQSRVDFLAGARARMRVYYERRRAELAAERAAHDELVALREKAIAKRKATDLPAPWEVPIPVPPPPAPIRTVHAVCCGDCECRPCRCAYDEHADVAWLAALADHDPIFTLEIGNPQREEQAA